MLDRPQSSFGQNKKRDGVSQMTAIFSQVSFHCIAFSASQIDWQIECVDKQNDFYRRVGLHFPAIECLKGNDALFPAIFEQIKICQLQTRYWLAGGVRNRHIQLD